MTSTTSVDISLKHKEMVILGTQYAGEMKKGVFRCAGAGAWRSQRIIACAHAQRRQRAVLAAAGMPYTHAPLSSPSPPHTHTHATKRSYMHYAMPKRGILSLHSGCNMGANGDVTLFFGLSGACGWRACGGVHATAGSAAPANTHGRVRRTSR
jgi:hypothetical protein